MKPISILGSTGSIGTQTLDVVRKTKDSLHIKALTAGTNFRLMERQAREFQPELVVMMDENAARQLKISLADTGIKISWGIEGLIEAAVIPETDTVVTAVSGRIGLEPTLAALKQGKNIALANKETLVAAGELVMRTAAETNAEIIPVDSEHSAIFQCLNGKREEAANITLTASGGPFLNWTREELRQATAEKALKHPNWKMGAKITIDSATMMNKGLEVIEAHWLFGFSYEEIKVLIHPQSIVHSFVEFNDASILAQMGEPDMRHPIQYALSYPQRWTSAYSRLNLAGKTLTFSEPDHKMFPFLEFAYTCGKKGGTLPAVMNAANEVCVHAFLKNRIKYFDLFNLVEKVCLEHQAQKADQLAVILDTDLWARERSEELICNMIK
ncbi:1-deoxy-D-xylulose 5-phosphate reductoisomerase [Syntrophobotulus glycolicus DSM 8271]|uniref:1-deoxy-D-xylulose 5-phosphate reductoisomerase n=1 Tax=Syntrophobotulus glycolicus (strain DSM 8271 / FlGlyR) TaxID=645991 RepID=F0SU99_SYNGF|nr:1-deoxy-D-xylulose-5-phosphate reductoisomerase [Syntrophobotulus glycolicus]ADY56549.1 1-deoxy-D-xylulose 5-phosphate reductoisomerase [Syntrophobotulus glycolicus DSM 8271]